MACALLELSHPRTQLLLISHLKDDVCPVLHLVGWKGLAVWDPWGVPVLPQGWKARSLTFSTKV